MDDGSLLHLEVSLEPTIQLTLLDRRKPFSSVAIVSQNTLVLAGEMCDGEVLQIDLPGRVVAPLSIIPNWAPIIDCKMIGDARQLITCSGFAEGGSVRFLSNELNAELITATDPDYGGSDLFLFSLSLPFFYYSLAKTFCPCLVFFSSTGIWALKNSSQDPHPSFLCVSFVASTRLLHSAGGELEDVSDASGLILNSSTLAIGIVPEGVIIQVCATGVNITRSKALAVGLEPISQRWTPPSDSHITVAKIHDNFLILALSKLQTVLVLQVIVGQDGFAIPFFLLLPPFFRFSSKQQTNKQKQLNLQSQSHRDRVISHRGRSLLH